MSGGVRVVVSGGVGVGWCLGGVGVRWCSGGGVRLVLVFGCFSGGVGVGWCSGGVGVGWCSDGVGVQVVLGWGWGGVLVGGVGVV